MSNSKLYDQIGRSGFSFDPDADPASTPGFEVRDEEIRQLLAAQNARRARRGEPLVDVEAELRRLTAAEATPIDPALRSEIHQMVLARNARRARRGEQPLDVEAEIERQIEELGRQ